MLVYSKQLEYSGKWNKQVKTIHRVSGCQHFCTLSFPPPYFLLLLDYFICNFYMVMIIFCAHFYTLHLSFNTTSYVFFMLPILHKQHFNGCITVHHINVLPFNNFFHYLFSFFIILSSGWKLWYDKHIPANIFLHIYFPLCLRLFHLDGFLEVELLAHNNPVWTFLRLLIH